jgi:PPP family 3-phenylpropionic acid transporter
MTTAPGHASASPNHPLRGWFGFAGFYATSFAVLAVYMQFFPVWLHDQCGLSASGLSFVLAGTTISRTLAGPLWAQRVDRLGDARVILVTLSCASCVAFALYGLPGNIGTWFAVAFAFGAVFSPMYPIVDAAALQTAHQAGFEFGRLRMVGSLAYLLAICAAGPCVERFGSAIVFPVLLAGIVAMAASSVRLPRGFGAVTAPPAERTAWWAPLRSGRVVLLMVAAALIQGSHATYYNLSTTHWRSHDISATTAAMLWGEAIVAEIVLLFVAKSTVERVRPTTLLMIGGAAAIVRWLAIGATTSVPLLFAINWLHSLSFVATYLGSLRALERRVPEHQRATAQGLLGAATSGVGMVVAGVAGGFLYQRWEAFAFLAMAAFAAPALVLAWRLRRQADAASRQPTTSAPHSPA